MIEIALLAAVRPTLLNVGGNRPAIGLVVHILQEARETFRFHLLATQIVMNALVSHYNLVNLAQKVV